MFKNSHIPFDSVLECQVPVDEVLITPHSVMYFDKDGFELTPLEIEYYREAGVEMNDYLYNTCAQRPWMVPDNLPDCLMLDHSMILQRYAFTCEARHQLQQFKNDVPGVRKMLSTRSKWGIDFSLDYVVDDKVIDLFHIEIDSYHLDEIEFIRDRATKTILNTDWEDGARRVYQLREKWQHMDGHAQSDWKARYFGFDRAENIRKTI